MKTFLGMKITVKGNSLVCQTYMIKRILKEFKMTETRTVSTPMEAKFDFTNEDILQNVL